MLVILLELVPQVFEEPGGRVLDDAIIDDPEHLVYGLTAIYNDGPAQQVILHLLRGEGRGYAVSRLRPQSLLAVEAGGIDHYVLHIRPLSRIVLNVKVALHISDQRLDVDAVDSTALAQAANGVFVRTHSRNKAAQGLPGHVRCSVPAVIGGTVDQHREGVVTYDPLVLSDVRAVVYGRP